MAWQVFGGAMSSNVGIVRCVVAELNPEKRYFLPNILTSFLTSHLGIEHERSYSFPSSRMQECYLDHLLVGY